MFKDLVSNLSLSPSVTSQLTFYARRLRGERITRQISAAFAVLLIGLQVVTIAAPPIAANASSGNDIIFGGVSSVSRLMQVYDQGNGGPGQSAAEIQALFNFFGISRADLAQAQPSTINSSDHSLLSLGRYRHLPSDQLLVIGGQEVFLRGLYTWDSPGTTSSYNAFVGHRSVDGGFYAVLYDCGNIVVRSIPSAPPSGPPALTISKAPLPGYPANGASVAPGATLGYRISFANTGQSAASHVFVEDPIPAHTTWTKYMGSGGATNYNEDTGTFPGPGAGGGVAHVWWGYASIPAGASGYYVDFTTTVDANTPNNTQICNTGYIRSDQTSQQSSPNQVCYTVSVSAPKPSTIPTPTVTPTVTPTAANLNCISLKATPDNGVLPVTTTFVAQGQASGQSIAEYDFDFGDSHTQSSAAPSASHTYSAVGDYVATVKIKGSSGAITYITPACTATVRALATPASVTQAKSAVNLTQGNIDATKVVANAGDVIRYTLTVSNSGGTPADFAGDLAKEHLEDVLEYADVTNNGGATLENGVLTWPSTTISANTTLTKTFEITVKNPIPDTPISASDPQSYDLKMDNVYGNLVRIDVAPPVPKQIEAAARSLPQTGAGTSLLTVLAFAALVVYFYMRNRQLITEIKILRHDYHGGGQ